MATASKNIMWLTISRIISLVLLFLAYAFLTRYLGAYQFGQFQFVLSYVTLFGVIIDFGIQQYIIKKISEQPEHAKKFFHNFLAIEVVLVVVVYAAMVSVAKINGYEPLVMRAIMIAGIGAAVHGLTYPFLAVITAFYDLKKAAFLNFLASLINVIIIGITIYFKLSILFLVCQQVIYASIAVVLYYHFVQKFIGKPQVLKGVRSLDWQLVRKIFKAALPFALLVGFSTLYNRIDVVLITKYLGYAETGLYTAAYKFFDLLAFFPAVVSHSLYPVFASLMAQRNVREIKQTMERYLRFMVAVSLPIAVGGMLLARPIITLLAGNQFADAAPVLAVLVWAPAILFMYIVVNSLVISQLTKFAMIITGANVVLNIVGNIILLPRVGIIGAAAMTVASEFIQGVFYFYFVRRKITNFKFFSNTWKPIIAAVVMGAVVWVVRDWQLFVVVILGAIVYALVLLSLQFFHKEDIVFAKKLLSRGA